MIVSSIYKLAPLYLFDTSSIQGHNTIFCMYRGVCHPAESYDHLPFLFDTRSSIYTDLLETE